MRALLTVVYTVDGRDGQPPAVEVIEGANEELFKAALSSRLMDFQRDKGDFKWRVVSHTVTLLPPTPRSGDNDPDGL